MIFSQAYEIGERFVAQLKRRSADFDLLIGDTEITYASLHQTIYVRVECDNALTNQSTVNICGLSGKGLVTSDLVQQVEFACEGLAKDLESRVAV